MLLICSEVLEGASSHHLKIFLATERMTHSITLPLVHAHGVMTTLFVQLVENCALCRMVSSTGLAQGIEIMFE